jgi:hypothetical protein
MCQKVPGRKTPGTCKRRPDVCPQYVLPVCACDGEVYNNECFAAVQGVDVSEHGNCPSED